MNNKTKTIILLLLIILFVASLLCVYFIKKLSENVLTNTSFSIINKDFELFEDKYNREKEYRGIKLLEYDNTNKDYAEIYYISYDYYTDPSYEFTVKIMDELNSSILISGEKEQRIIGGVISSAKIKKQEKKNIITFAVYEKEGDKTLNTNSVQINIGKDLEVKKSINQSKDLKEAKLLDCKFKYIDNQYIYYGTIENEYSEKLIGENYSIPIKVQYGNRLLQAEHIDFSGEKNVNNLNLENAFNSLALITSEFGQYGLSDVYSLDIANSNGQESLLVSYDELIKLCNGQSIQKNGKTYTKYSFERFAEIAYKKQAEVTIGNGIKAIKYSNDKDKDYDYYMFMHKDNIYFITVPNEERANEIVSLFLNSIQTN